MKSYGRADENFLKKAAAICFVVPAVFPTVTLVVAVAYKTSFLGKAISILENVIN